MKAATRGKKRKWCLHKSVLPAALSGMALVFTMCQTTPTPAAAMEETLNDFLREPPFELVSEELPPAGEAAQTEASNSDLSLSPPQITPTEPPLEQIKEFAEAVQGDTYAFPEEAAPKYAGGGRRRP